MTTMMVVVGVWFFQAYIRDETEVMCLYKKEKKLKKGCYSQQNAMPLCNSLPTLLKFVTMHFCERFILTISYQDKQDTIYRNKN